MLTDIIQIINNSNPSLDGATLLCDYQIDDLLLFEALLENGILENLLTENAKIGDHIRLEFSIFKLNTAGFFYDKSFFIKQHRYEPPAHSIYFNDLQLYAHETIFYSSYIAVVNLINTLILNSKHSYSDSGIKNSIMVREEKSLLLNLNYNGIVLSAMTSSTLDHINSFISIISDDNFQDKKNIYLNELVEFCLNHDEESRFSVLLENFDTFLNKASVTYNFYLRNFSYNKLKLEIDAKALEYNQKLQAVINDSQTKLIAIPAAFILVLSSLDYQKIDSIKNIISLGGLFLFSFLLQLFVDNQKSAVKFIEENINHYKSTFKNQARKEVEKAFDIVNSEKNKQSARLLYIEIILWFIPMFTTSMMLFFMSFQIVAIIIMFFFFWISSSKIFLKY